MQTRLAIEDGDVRATVQRLLEGLLEAGIVEAVMVPLRERSGAVAPALVSRPELLSRAEPLAPVLGVNSARVVSRLSVSEPRGHVAAVLRSCEIRALIELVKLQQASLDDLLIIGIDCAGTYSVTDYAELLEQQDAAELTRDLYAEPLAEHNLRDACLMCEKPLPEGAQVTIQLFGEPSDWLTVDLPDVMGEKLGLEQTDGGLRPHRADELIAARTAQRDANFAEIRARLSGAEGLADLFDTCIRCHNCMVNCPICYCKTCLFRTPAFDHEPAQYMTWALRKGATRLPTDTLLFHLTRLNHMSTSCVGCGMCTDACPSDIPVGRVFRAVAEQTQAIFEYTPGRSVDDQLPVTTFREDELEHTAIK